MSEKKLTRRETRKELFKLIFETEIQGNSLQEAYQKSFFLESMQAENTKEFVERYVTSLEENKAFVQEKIENSMTDWDFLRIGYVERSLLRLATYEIYFEDLPLEVAINEAVELAKIYGDVKTHEFINGVLARIVEHKK